ncbi:Homeodomain-like domain-containing protein [Thermosyntropha lipolytica DSM 11003]|uniref:Homeodomain-like domain-containing protein n=1 Tax=Thermosyntropha lipolytica DSM 11003 TaxID=1123382 RepID=A0A1M5S2U1_9FIRM|nr:Homeodomain-like domain-containing protein [Thermosyntropha lipolytica DSM 11003]
MDQYHLIRHLYLVEGMSQRAIAKQLGISRNTVRRYCKGEQVPWERKPVKRAPSVITPGEALSLLPTWSSRVGQKSFRILC